MLEIERGAHRDVVNADSTLRFSYPGGGGRSIDVHSLENLIWDDTKWKKLRDLLIPGPPTAQNQSCPYCGVYIVDASLHMTWHQSTLPDLARNSIIEGLGGHPE